MIGSTEGLLILLVVLVLFGGSQVPKLARALGSSVNSFKKGLKDGEEEDLESALKTVSVYEKKEPVAAQPVEKKVPEKKAVVKKASAKPVVKKTAVKPAAKKAPAKKTTASKAPVKKAAATKKTTSKKMEPAKKTAAKTVK